MYIDSHCHLDYPVLKDNIADVLKRACANDVHKMLTISTDLSKRDVIRDMITTYDNIWGTVGVHPHEAEKELSQISVDDLKSQLLDEAQQDKIVAFGETGLDYFYEHSPKKEQKDSFAAHIEAGLEKDLPLIVHTRDAEEDTIEMLRDVGGGKSQGVIHCFSGSQWLAEQSLELGYFISVSGIITFKKADELREVIKNVPLERLLIETDAPYLAPVPFRGKDNEPSFVIHTAERLAELKNVSLKQIADQTTKNFYNLFQKVKS